MHFKVLTFTTSFPLFGRLSQRKTLSQKMKKKPGVCGLSKRSTIFNDFPQNKGEIVHDNKKIAAKFHLWSNKTRSKENTLPGFIGGRNLTSSRTPAYIAAILTIGAWISKEGRPSSRAAGRSGSRWAGELPACFLLSPTNSFRVSVSRRWPFFDDFIRQLQLPAFHLSPSPTGRNMCIRQILGYEIPVLYAASACIKPIKYVHVNAFRAVFCAAIIKFLIVAFYSHVFSSSHCLSVGQGNMGRMDGGMDWRTGGLDDQRTNGPVRLVISFLLRWLIELRSDGELGIFSLPRTVDMITKMKWYKLISICGYSKREVLVTKIFLWLEKVVFLLEFQRTKVCLLLAIFLWANPTVHHLFYFFPRHPNEN